MRQWPIIFILRPPARTSNIHGGFSTLLDPLSLPQEKRIFSPHSQIMAAYFSNHVLLICQIIICTERSNTKTNQSEDTYKLVIKRLDMKEQDSVASAGSDIILRTDFVSSFFVLRCILGHFCNVLL